MRRAYWRSPNQFSNGAEHTLIKRFIVFAGRWAKWLTASEGNRGEPDSLAASAPNLPRARNPDWNRMGAAFHRNNGRSLAESLQFAIHRPVAFRKNAQHHPAPQPFDGQAQGGAQIAVRINGHGPRGASEPGLKAAFQQPGRAQTEYAPEDRIG